MKSHDNQWRYDKLVLATGATPFIPSVPGRELMLTLNSQREYGAAQSRLHDAKRVLIVGGGLIGCELAMDFCRAGKAVTVVDNSASVLAALMPPEASSRLQHRLTEMGVHLMLKTQLEGLEQTADGIRVSLDRQRAITVDAVVAAAGLRRKRRWRATPDCRLTAVLWSIASCKPATRRFMRSATVRKSTAWYCRSCSRFYSAPCA